MTQIFIRNLTYSTSETDLRSLFDQYGRVHSVRLATDKSTGQSRGFAFITMGRLEDADEAIVRLNGAQLHGRSIVVTEARGDSENSTSSSTSNSADRNDAITRLNLL